MIDRNTYVVRTIEKTDTPAGGKSVKVTDAPVPITDEMVERAAKAYRDLTEHPVWSYAGVRAALDAALNGGNR